MLQLIREILAFKMSKKNVQMCLLLYDNNNSQIARKDDCRYQFSGAHSAVGAHSTNPLYFLRLSISGSKNVGDRML